MMMRRVFGFDGARGRRPVLSASMLAIAPLLAMPALAQQAPARQVPARAPAPQSPAQQPTVQPPQILPPPLPAATPLPLPQLSPAQATQLAALLDAEGVTQGLRQSDGAPAAPLAGDDLVRAALDLARAVHAGRLDTTDFQKDWGLRPPPYDPLPAFADAVRRDRLAAWMVSLAPPYAGYDGLRKGLADYRRLAAAGGWTTLEAGPDMTLGAKGPRVVALRERLAIEDGQVVANGDKFDAELVEAVRRAQRRYGLNPTGVVSGQTLAALNVSAADRVRQIMANMERWRWLPQEMPKDRIQVNIAAAVLTVFDGDVPVASMRAVTGRPGDETPMLSSQIHSIVLNPPWNVPSSIATRELWPKEAKNPGYLKRNGFKVIDTGDGGKRLQQAAGTKSALGRYKFDFDNAYAVYLHDTPSQAKFASYSRLASHGCVRLEKPAALAELLLKDDPAWGSDAIKTAVDSGDTQRVKLAKPVSVYLLYWTAFASANGQMNFRGDPYAWDSTLASKIVARSARQAIASK